MNWQSVAIAIGRVMVFVANARQLRSGSQEPRRRHGVGTAAALALLLAVPVYAGGPESPPAYFAGGLTDQSSWEEILKTRGVRAEFPQVGFGTMFVSLQSLCLEGDMLAIADRRIDTGLRVSADRIGNPGPARAAAGGSSGGQAAASGRIRSDAPSGPSERPNPAPRIYPVDVVRIIETGLSPTRVFLFRKDWQVPACTGR
jgi:hypothetical protein